MPLASSVLRNAGAYGPRLSAHIRRPPVVHTNTYFKRRKVRLSCWLGQGEPIRLRVASRRYLSVRTGTSARAFSGWKEIEICWTGGQRLAHGVGRRGVDARSVPDCQAARPGQDADHPSTTLRAMRESSMDSRPYVEHNLAVRSVGSELYLPSCVANESRQHSPRNCGDRWRTSPLLSCWSCSLLSSWCPRPAARIARLQLQSQLELLRGPLLPPLARHRHRRRPGLRLRSSLRRAFRPQPRCQLLQVFN